MAIPRFAVAEYTTPELSFAEDLTLYASLRVEGIGIDERKLTKGARDLERFRESGLAASSYFPATPSVLPLPRWPGPDEPAARVEAICRGIDRLAPFEPRCCVCITGPGGAYRANDARERVVSGLKEVARAAADAGMTLAIEAIHASIAVDWTFVTTIPDMVELLNEIDEPNTAMAFDVWHLWDTPNLLPQVREFAPRFCSVHLDDWREPTRSWCDRALPGSGVADLPGIFGALDEGGFDGWVELEIFSDDGSFGSDFPDSLWRLDPAELVRTGRESFQSLWQARKTTTREPEHKQGGACR
jgi:sugar phosphate isomerase/epimerase